MSGEQKKKFTRVVERKDIDFFGLIWSLVHWNDWVEEWSYLYWSVPDEKYSYLTTPLPFLF